MKLFMQRDDALYTWSAHEALLTRTHSMWGVFDRRGGSILSYMFDRAAAMKRAKQITTEYGIVRLIVIRLPVNAYK